MPLSNLCNVLQMLLFFLARAERICTELAQLLEFFTARFGSPCSRTKKAPDPSDRALYVIVVVCGYTIVPVFS
jgi:hypothetical protein